ncbi:MAG: flagellar protein FliT [Gammaproteobacteria bacterium]
MAHPSQWQQLFELTQIMVQAAEDQQWTEVNELQQARDQLMTTLPDATLLTQSLHLNQALANLGNEQRDQLAGKLQQGQKKRQGISAYQAVTAQYH